MPPARPSKAKRSGKKDDPGEPDLPQEDGFMSAAEYEARQKERGDQTDAERATTTGRPRRKIPTVTPTTRTPPKPPRPEDAPGTPRSAPFPDALDPRIRAAVESLGIKSLYPPQREALDEILMDRNVLVSIPTASGKSLIAHMGIFHNLLTRGGKAVYIVPLRALASEKFEELRELATLVKEPRLRVGIATGDLDEADTRLAAYDIIVTTSEKADSLIRHSAGWIHELSCVVADEVHLLGDSGRGPTLEVTLARLMAIDKRVRIIALSATIGNARDLAEWLGGHLVQSSWRPVALKEGVLHEDTIVFADGTVQEVHGHADKVTRLVLDTARSGAQTLVFVNTRKSTEAVALKLATALKGSLQEDEKKVLEEAAARLEEEDGEHSRLGAKLAAALRGGAAFHNAGLSGAQRRVVEDLFRARRLRAIVATPTLAAGVNLPARRVVVRDVRRFEADVGNVPLPVLEVKQMTGRAGRPRYDPYGEAVLVAKTEDERDMLIETYLWGEPERITSGLGAESALRIHLLAGIATGLTPDRKTVDAFIDSTFLARDPGYGGKWRIARHVDDVLHYLHDQGFIETRDDRLIATRFGKRTSDLYIDPMSALTIRDGLAYAKLVPQVDDLALLALVASTPDVLPLWLKKNDEWVEAVADENEGRWLRAPLRDPAEREVFLAELKTALLLNDWISEVRLERMEERYGLGPGDIHNRVTTAEWLAYAAEEIARMESSDVAGQLKDLRRRIHFGAKAELLPLLALEGIGRYRARVLVQAGLATMAKLRNAPAEKLLTLPGFGPRVVQALLKQLGRDEDLGSIKKKEQVVAARKAKAQEDDAESSRGGDADATADASADQAADVKPTRAQTRLSSFGED